MPQNGLEVFDNTIQKTFEWLNELMRLMHWSDRQRAYLVLRGTLQGLRDRLPLEHAVKLGAQLPMLVRGFYYEGWKPSATPVKIKNSEDFFDFVASHFANISPTRDIDIEQAVQAVFQVLSNHISEGEVSHIKKVLPEAIAKLWPTKIAHN